MAKIIIRFTTKVCEHINRHLGIGTARKEISLNIVEGYFWLR